MEEKERMVRPFGFRDKIGYLFGDFGNDFTFLLSSMFMMKFYTDVMGIRAGLVGVLMMAARFLDAFTDVTMGQIVDRSKPTRYGKFRPWILRMCVPVAFSSFLIYQSSFARASLGFRIFWMFFTYLLWGSVFYTSINIPYGSMASAISAEPKARAQLSVFRTAGASLASLAIGVLTPLFAYETVRGATVLSGRKMTFIAGLFSAAAIICYVLCFFLVKERVKVPQNTGKLAIGDMFRNIFQNQALLGIIAAAIFLLVAQLGISGMQPYIFPIYYNSALGQSVVSFAGTAATLLICVPLSVPLSEKFGKRELSAVSCFAGAVLWLLCLLIRPGNVWVYILFQTLAMVALGFFNAVIWAMITDVIDDAEVVNHVREDGAIYSVYSFSRKLGQALSSGMIGAVLTMIGYTSRVADDPAAYPGVLSRMFTWAALIPAIGLLAVTAALWFLYPLSRRKVEENVRELKSRRESSSEQNSSEFS